MHETERRFSQHRANVQRTSPIGLRSIRLHLNMESVGEFVLSGLTGAFFLYLLLESRGWPLGAALMPRVVATTGLLFLILRLGMLLRNRTEPQGRIMDTGFTESDDGDAALIRFLTVFGSLVALIVGIWLFGWHIALPVYIFLYLLIFGRVRWWWAAISAGLFLALLIGVYDAVFHTPWNEPALFRLFGW